jgi:thermitase
MSDADIDAPEAWDLTKGSNDIVVAVVDSGVDYNHEDLAANIFWNEADCNTNGIDDDRNGYVDDCHGIDVYNNDSDPMDDRGHGTHVAGIIGAVGNNNVGVVGVNWNVKILPCKFLNRSGNRSVPGLIACMQYIVDLKDRGVNILAGNFSIGGSPPDPDEADAIDELGKRGLLVFAAAGNGDANGIGINLDENPDYPASFFLPNAIAVAAANSSDSITVFSNYGLHTVHLGAPGEGILSTMAPSSSLAITRCGSSNALYCSLPGTSMATPFVIGVAALLKAHNPSLDWRGIKNLILAGGENVPGLAGKTVTGKRLNANEALTCTNSNVLAAVQPRPKMVFGTVGEPVDLAALHINCGSPNGEVQVSADPR